MTIDSRRSYPSSNSHHQFNQDWNMSIKCYSQDVGEVTAQLSNLLANFKKVRDMLDSGKTGVTSDKPYGTFGCERLKNTGRVVLKVVDKNGTQIGQSTNICAVVRQEKFVRDERSGLIVPLSKQDIVPWRESLKLAIKVVTNTMHYMEMGKFIKNMLAGWDDVDKLSPQADALQHNLNHLSVEGDGGELGVLRDYLVSFVWPLANGRAFNNLDDGFSREASLDEKGGCWIYSQIDTVTNRVVELQTKQLAELDKDEAQKLADAPIAPLERKELVAAAQATVASETKTTAEPAVAVAAQNA